jgi:transporter family-2 protein
MPDPASSSESPGSPTSRSQPSVNLPTDPDEILAVAASVVAGAFVALMIRLNATLGEHVGVLEGSFVVHLVGTVFSTLLVVPRFQWTRVQRLRSAPARLFVGGALGVFIVLLANVVVPVLGVALTLSLSVTANLTFSTVADHFGWFGLPVFPVTPRRLLGLALTVLGVLLVAFG